MDRESHACNTLAQKEGEPPKRLPSLESQVCLDHFPKAPSSFTFSINTLIVAGERDAFTPRAVSEEMAQANPAARLEIHEGATHYVPVEYPGRLSDDLRAFFGQAGFSGIRDP